MNAEEYASGKLVLDFPADAVGRLRLNNPDKRNPLDHEVLDALAAVLPELDRGIDIRCVVITGTGKAFSAGYDIGSIPAESFERDAEALVAHPFAAAMDAVSAHPFPVLAAINGHCLGGGLELAVRCDLRVCAAGAKLGMPPAKLGLIYGHTGLERFIDVIGVAATRDLFLTGRVVDAERGASDRPRERARGRRRDRGCLRGPGGRDRRQRAALDEGQQARDRDARAKEPASPTRWSASWWSSGSRALRPRTSARA